MFVNLESLAHRNGNIGSTRSTATAFDSATWKLEEMGALSYVGVVGGSYYIYYSGKVT